MGTLLADLVAVEPGVFAGGVSRLGRSAGSRNERCYRRKVLMSRADGFDNKGVGGLGAVNDDWFPNAEPVFDVCGGASLDPTVDGRVGVSNEEVSVCSKDVGAFGV